MIKTIDLIVSGVLEDNKKLHLNNCLRDNVKIKRS